MTSCITGALSGRYILIGSARAAYDESGLLGPAELGSVEGGLPGSPGVEWEGIGRGINLDAIRVYES